MLPELNELCSANFRFLDLCHCGDTWELHQPANRPQQLQTYQDLTALSQQLLAPIRSQFGKPVLTYGFAGPELQKLIRRNENPRVAPHLDQHAASELNTTGHLICKRQGAAVDLYIPEVDSFLLAAWVAEHLPFDRMYVYERHRPIHLSYHQSPNTQIVWMRQLASSKNRVPCRMTIDQLYKLVGFESC